MPLNDKPDGLEVDAEIMVDNDIFDPCDPLPWDLGIFCPNLFGNLSACLSNDLEVTDHRIDGLLVLEEIFL